MIALQLSPRDRRAIALGLWILVPALLTIAVIRPMASGWFEARAALSRERTLLARERGLLPSARDYAQALHDTRVLRARAMARAFTGPDAITASAALARYVRELATRSGLHVEISESRVSSTSPAGLLLEADARATGDLRDIVEFLQALERGSRIASVERLTITARDPTMLRDGDDAPLSLALTVQSIANAYAADTARQAGGSS